MKMIVGAVERQLTHGGSISGTSRNGVSTFRNIPYATAPVGALRFRAPQPVVPWTGVRDGRKHGPIAPQLPSRADSVMGPIVAPQDEDCLTLTVWSPAGGAKDLPVMVWIHGGGFLTGAGSLDWYDGSALVEREQIVVVGINYRLGVLGYLSAPGIVPGNLALLDQLEALRWVKANIATFGGNPKAVTVAGESGGAHSIASLLTSPASTGLFARAILQSAPLGIGLATATEASRRARFLLDALGFEAGRSGLDEKLRAISVEQVLRAQGESVAAVMASTTLGDLRPAFLPTAEAPHPAQEIDFVSAAADAAARRNVDVLIGWTRDEAALFLANHPALTTANREKIHELAHALWGREAAEQRLSPHESSTDSVADRFIDAVTAATFRDDTLRFAAEIEARGGNVFTYQFDWSSPAPRLGACHCLDIPFVFGTASVWSATPLLKGADPATVARVTELMMSHWGSFVRSGSPGFPAWTAGSRPLMHFDDPGWLETLPALVKHEDGRGA